MIKLLKVEAVNNCDVYVLECSSSNVEWGLLEYTIELLKQLGKEILDMGEHELNDGSLITWVSFK